ncbi:DUF2666 family protein [Thermococcus sp.]
MKVEEHIMFTAKHGNWKVGDKLLVMESSKIAHFLASISNTVNTKIPEYLIDVMNVPGIISLAEELAEGELAEMFRALKSPGTSRKLGKLVFEDNKKLKKNIVDVARAFLVRETLSRKVSVDYPEDKIEELRIVLPYHDEHINFTAKHGSWIVVKRLIIDEKTPLADVARILASINETITLKLPVYAGIDMEGINSWFGDIKKARSKTEIETLINKYLHFPAHEYAAEGFEEHARVYALRKALEKTGLTVDLPAKSLEKYLEKKA